MPALNIVEAFDVVEHVSLGRSVAGGSGGAWRLADVNLDWSADLDFFIFYDGISLLILSTTGESKDNRKMCAEVDTVVVRGPP